MSSPMRRLGAALVALSRTASSSAAGPSTSAPASAIGRSLLPHSGPSRHLSYLAAAQPVVAAHALQAGSSASAPQLLLVRSLAAQAQVDAKGKQEGKFDSLELTDEKINAITDKIPQRPVGVVEGTSYMAIIIAAFGALAFVLYQFAVNFIFEPTAITCFNHTLERLKSDPRITVRLGAADDIRAWGSNSQSRVARQQIPHQIYNDQAGVEHVRIQFYMRGPGGTGLVNADMHKDDKGSWQYTYLLIDVYSGNSQTPQRVHIVSPR